MSDSLSPSERYALLQTLNNLPPPTFEVLRFSVGAPQDVIPGATAPQGSRGVAFLEWAKSPVGCGLSEVIEMLDQIAPGAFRALSSPKAAVVSPTPEATPEQDAQQNFQEDLGGSVTLDMVYIPGGRFWMGSPEDEEGREDREGPQHKVQVSLFYMSKFLVTQAQWRAVSLLDDVGQELQDETWHQKAIEAENLIKGDIVAGVPGRRGWMMTWSQLESYAEYMQVRSMVLRGFANLIRQGNLGVGQDAAITCGKQVIFERMMGASITVQEQVLSLIDWQHIGPKTELTPERMAVLQTVFHEVMTPADWDAIAQAAAQ